MRWARFEARVEWGDERGALGDAESLEAAARNASERHQVLTRAADQLVRRGYVTRSRDAADRRVVNLRLTAAGARLRDAQSVLDPIRVKTMILRLSPEDRQDAVRGLALLARAASEEMHTRSSKTSGSRKQQPVDPHKRRRNK